MAKDDKANPPIRSGPPRIEFDLRKYEALLEDETISAADKRELLQTLWNIVTEFVSLGFGVHPLQQAQSACGQVGEYSPEAPAEQGSEVYLDHTLITTDFLTAAKGGTL